MKTLTLYLLTVLLALPMPVCEDTPEPPLTQQRCATEIGSPHGSASGKVCSPDGTYFAEELAEKGYGRIGLYSLSSNKLIKVLEFTTHPDGQYRNDLKGLAFSPNSERLAAMFHHGSGGHLSVVHVATGVETYHALKGWAHRLRFNGNNSIRVGEQIIRLR